MKDKMLLGLGRKAVELPRPLWQRHLRHEGEHAETRLDFMSADHHRVRDFAVLELPRLGRPLSPDYIAQRLELPSERVVAILDELERNMTFLFRGDGEAVTWAYPVTVDRTPHHITFDTGEEAYAA
jgi:hypothetical protein